MAGFGKDYPPGEESEYIPQPAGGSRHRKAQGCNIFQLYWVSRNVSVFDISTVGATPSEISQQNSAWT